MDATHWRRYGKDRLYVRDVGANFGWWDLTTDEGHPASPALESSLVVAVTDWRASMNSLLPPRMAPSKPNVANIPRHRHPTQLPMSTSRPRPQTGQYR